MMRVTKEWEEFYVQGHEAEAAQIAVLEAEKTLLRAVMKLNELGDLAEIADLKRENERLRSRLARRESRPEPSSSGATK